MTTKDTIIGMLNGYEHSQIVTVEDVRNEILNGCYYDAIKYTDFRFGTNLERFTYDPYTGHKISWKKVRKLLEGA